MSSVSWRGLLPFLALAAALVAVLVLWLPDERPPDRTPPLERSSIPSAPEPRTPRQLHVEAPPAPKEPAAADRAAPETADEEAAPDPDPRKLDTYASYTPKDLAQERRPRGNVRAANVIAVMLDPPTGFRHRMRAQQSLVEAATMRGDPDLSMRKRAGAASARAVFSLEHAVPALASDDRKTRKLVHDLLVRLWRAREAGIRAYNHGDESTWAPAIEAWRGWLRKR